MSIDAPGALRRRSPSTLTLIRPLAFMDHLTSETEAEARCEDVRAVHHVGRHEDVEAVRVRARPRDAEARLERVEVLDEPEPLHLLEPRERLAADHARR